MKYFIELNTIFYFKIITFFKIERLITCKIKLIKFKFNQVIKFKITIYSNYNGQIDVEHKTLQLIHCLFTHFADIFSIRYLSIIPKKATWCLMFIYIEYTISLPILNWHIEILVHHILDLHKTINHIILKHWSLKFNYSQHKVETLLIKWQLHLVSLPQSLWSAALPLPPTGHDWNVWSWPILLF